MCIFLGRGGKGLEGQTGGCRWSVRPGRHARGSAWAPAVPLSGCPSARPGGWEGAALEAPGVASVPSLPLGSP